MSDVSIAPSKPVGQYPTHTQAKAMLAGIRTGKAWIDGKPVTRPKFEVERDLRDGVLAHLAARGEFFLNEGQPYYLDRALDRLYVVGSDASGLRPLLAALDLDWKGQHTAAVASSIATHASDSFVTPELMIHRLAYCDGQITYLYQSPQSMIRITAKGYHEVPIGTDDVILISDLGTLPAIADITPHIKAVKAKLGNHCTRIRPDLPLTRHLTSRWATDADLSATQLHQMFMSRFLFLGVASLYGTWPVWVFTGEGGSGKSSIVESALVFLSGRVAKDELPKLPSNEDDFEVRVFRCTMAMFDNVDRAGLDRPDKASYADTICGLATGMKATRRIKYHRRRAGDAHLPPYLDHCMYLPLPTGPIRHYAPRPGVPNGQARSGFSHRQEEAVHRAAHRSQRDGC